MGVCLPWDQCEGCTLVEEEGHLGLGVTTLEEGIKNLEVGHKTLGTLDPPCKYVQEERLS